MGRRRNKRNGKKKILLVARTSHGSARRCERIRVRKTEEKAWKESDFRPSDSNLLLLLLLLHLPFIVTLDRIDRSVHEPFYPKQPRTTLSLSLSRFSRPPFLIVWPTVQPPLSVFWHHRVGGGRGWARETHLNHVQRRVKCNRTTRLRIYTRATTSVTNHLLFSTFLSPLFSPHRFRRPVIVSPFHVHLSIPSLSLYFSLYFFPNVP